MGHMGILAMISSLATQDPQDIAIEGVIVNGSYNPTYNTVQVVMGHTVAAAAFQLPNGQQVQPTVVTASLKVSGWEQYGPIGGEAVTLKKAGTQWIAELEFATDGVSNLPPGAPSGERWIVHRNPTTQLVNGYTKWTNDGATPGDKLGGFKNLVGGYASFVTTNGLSITLDDTADTITLTNGAGTIVLTSSGVLINGATATTGDGVARQSDLAALANAIITAIGTWASAHVQGGSGASAPTFSYTPTGSSTSFAG